MGIAVDSKNSQIFTIGKDKKLKVTDLGYQQTHTDISVGNYELQCLHFEEESQKLFIGNGAGELYYFGFTAKTPVLIKEIQLGSVSIVKGIAMDITRNYVFTCN